MRSFGCDPSDGADNALVAVDESHDAVGDGATLLRESNLRHVLSFRS